MTPEDVAKLSAATTPGPWRWQDEEECLVGVYQIVMRQDERGRMTFAEYPDGTHKDNAAFIAAAHDMADLIAEQAKVMAAARRLAQHVTTLQISGNKVKSPDIDAALAEYWEAHDAYRAARGQK